MVMVLARRNGYEEGGRGVGKERREGGGEERREGKSGFFLVNKVVITADKVQVFR